MAFNSTEPSDSILEGYLRRVRRRPVSKKDVQKALRPYGRQFGTAEGKTDARLYQIATNEVLEWFRGRMRRKTKRGNAKPQGGRNRNRTSGGSRVRTAPARTQSSGAMLPDTSMPRTSVRTTSGTSLPNIRDPKGSRSAPTTSSSGIRIQRPAGRGFTER